MTNEQRFIASCESVGEAYVRQKLSGGRYSEPKIAWANSWLEQVESSKSEATKAEEKGRHLARGTQGPRLFQTCAFSTDLCVRGRQRRDVYEVRVSKSHGRCTWG